MVAGCVMPESRTSPALTLGDISFLQLAALSLREIKWILDTVVYRSWSPTG